VKLINIGYATRMMTPESDKVTALFEPHHHARWYGAISFEIRRSMCGSAATSNPEPKP